MFRLFAVFPISLPLFAAVAVVCTQPGAGQARAEDVESAEARTALNALVKENELLQRQLREAEESKAGLQKNLANATGEAEVLKRQLMELRLRLEAFGLRGEGGEAGLEQRLLKAVSALRAAEEQKSALATAVITLLDGVEKSKQSASEADAETKAMMEAAVRQGRQALAEVDGTKTQSEAADSASQTIHEGSVIAIKDELALVVTSLGREGGVKVGMPFRVIRGDKEIGSVRIVDVRDRISGAVVQELSSDAEKIRVGDKLRIGVDRRL
jgi:hypothetical protein